MIRVLAFLLAVGCCIGLMAGTYTAISDTGDEVSFTEKVHYGDPSVMDGRTVRFGVDCGDHMRWRFDYRFGPEDSHDTEFLFSQDNLSVFSPQETAVLEVYVHSGAGMSSSGGNGFETGSTGYGDMIRTVAALTPAGGELEMNLKLADFLDYHSPNFSLDYTSDRYGCMEYVDVFSQISSGDYVDSPSYRDFCDLFRFPVLPDQIVSIQISKDEMGIIRNVYYNMENDIQINVINAATEEGLYCVPVYLKNFGTNQVIPGEYAQGMGMYFIPWKIYENGYSYSGGKQAVTLDVSNAKNIWPMPETAVVYRLEVDEETQTAWMLSLEDGVYVLTWLDLAGKQVLERLELMDYDPESGEDQPSLYSSNGLIMVCVGEQLALVTMQDPKVEFIVPMGEVRNGFYYFTSKTGTMLYEDGVLYLADRPYYNDYLNVMVFDKTGPLFHGEYNCSLFDAQGGNPYLQSQYVVTELE